MDDKAFVEAQESIVNEIGMAIEELKAGKYINVYCRLTNLCDALIGDIAISKSKELD